MPDDRIVMPQGDTLPVLEVTLTDDAGRPVELEGSTVTIQAVDLDGNVSWEHAAVVEDQLVTLGGVSYQWQAADTATPFEGYLRFPVVFADGNRRTYPGGVGLPFTVGAQGTVQSDLWVIDFDAVAPRLDLPVPLSEDDRRKVATIVAGVQDDVEAELDRPITVRRFTERVRNDWRDPYGWWTEWDPVVSFIEQVDLGDGWTQITYTAGYDGRSIPAIRRYVTEHTIMQWRESPWGKRRVRRMSVEGQSLQYEDFKEAGQPGGPPKLASLAAYRRRTVHSRPRYSAQPPSNYTSAGIEMGTVAGIYVIPGYGEGSDLFVGDASGQQWAM